MTTIFSWTAVVLASAMVSLTLLGLSWYLLFQWFDWTMRKAEQADGIISLARSVDAEEQR